MYVGMVTRMPAWAMPILAQAGLFYFSFIFCVLACCLFLLLYQF